MVDNEIDFSYNTNTETQGMNMLKPLIFAALTVMSATAQAGATEQVLAGVLLNQAFNEMREQRRQPPPATSVIMYPVPVHQPQSIYIPRCTPNVPCPNTIVIQCDHMPMFDTYGRIVGYHKICR
jgi:hypothetical protein